MKYPIKTLQQLRPILIGFRKEARLSQAAVASLLGVTQQSYAKIEANPSATSVEKLFTILRLLGAEIVLDRNDSAAPLNQSGQTGERGHEPASTSVLTGKPTSPGPRKVLPPTLKKENW